MNSTVERIISEQKVLIDESDSWILDRYSWWYSSKGGVQRRPVKNGKIIILARLLMECPPNKRVDHINRCNWDNRRENLRIVTAQQNSQNKSKSDTICRTMSQFKGVTFSSYHKKWKSTIYISGNCLFLGYFTSEVDAATAYNKAARKYFKEFAVLNTVNGIEL